MVFLLLLFFLLTADPAPDPTLDVQLPEARGSRENLPAREVVIVMKSDGALHVDAPRWTCAESRHICGRPPLQKYRVVLRGDRSRAMTVRGNSGNYGGIRLPLHVAVDSADKKASP